MSKDESRPKPGQPSAPAQPYTGTESLDFTDRTIKLPPEADAAAAPEASRTASGARRRKTTGKSSDQDKAGSSRRLAVPFLIVVAIGVVIAFAMTDRSSKEPVTPPSSATPGAPGAPAYQSPPTQRPTQTDTPPPSASAPQGAYVAPTRPTTSIPAEFLKAFQEYLEKPGSKAVALALDTDGRSAHVSVFGRPTSSEANEEALSECRRFKVQAGVQANCRLYAVGDEVIWDK